MKGKVGLVKSKSRHQAAFELDVSIVLIVNDATVFAICCAIASLFAA